MSGLVYVVSCGTSSGWIRIKNVLCIYPSRKSGPGHESTAWKRGLGRRPGYPSICLKFCPFACAWCIKHLVSHDLYTICQRCSNPFPKVTLLYNMGHYFLDIQYLLIQQDARESCTKMAIFSVRLQITSYITIYLNKDKLSISCKYIYTYICYFCVWCVPNMCRSALAKSLLLNIFQNFVRNKLHTPFLPYFDTQHLICIFFYFVHFFD